VECPRCKAPNMMLIYGYGKDVDRYICKNKITRADGSVWYCNYQENVKNDEQLIERSKLEQVEN